MPDVNLPNTGLVQVTIGGSKNTWGSKVNNNMEIVDDLFGGVGGHDHTTDGAPIPPGGLKGLGDLADGVVAAMGDGTFSVVSGGDLLDIHALPSKATPVAADELVLADSAASWAAKRVARDSLLVGAQISGVFFHNSMGNKSDTVTLDFGQYSSFKMTATGNITLAVSNATSGKAYMAVIEISNAGAYTLNFPGGSTWPGGTKPTFSPSGVDLIFMLTSDGGSTFRCTAEIDTK